MLQSILMLVMGMLGILIYNLYKILPHLRSNTFSLAIFMRENKKYLLWTVCVMAVVMAIISIDPMAIDFVGNLTSLDLINNHRGWLVFGFGLSGFVRNTSKLKSNNRARKTRGY